MNIATHLRQTESWISWVRLGGVGFAVLQILLSTGYPAGYEATAWVITAVFAAGAVVIWLVARRDLPRRAQLWLSVAALLFDTAALSAYLLVFDWETGSPVRQVLYLAVIEAAVRFGIVGPVVIGLATTPVLVVFERARSHRLGLDHVRVDYVTFQLGNEIIVGLIVGWLVLRLQRETVVSERRAREAEDLRDLLGHRVDALEAANRCARALGSSLDLETAFAAFLREVRGVVPFDRVAVVLAEGDRLEVLAAAGVGSDVVFPPGSSRPVERSIFEELAHGRTIYRRDMNDRLHAEEDDLLALGLRSRLTAPLVVGAHPVGLISFVRREPDAFAPEEVELVSLIGRLAATAVQNIRAYDAERRTVEELRRLSALRADFVSLVSHELRSPMAAVIGSARTLQERWRELSPEQRAAFLALIADETQRLANLIGDVLDTSRIDAGTFNYTFADVDLSELVEEAVSTAAMGQDEVTVSAHVQPVPAIRGDRARLRQVLSNLVDNAVKYSNAGGTVDVDVSTSNGSVFVVVSDDGPGVPADQQRLIFEKFGRAAGTTGKPGTGLGLFIARSIVEAHGGTLEVSSRTGRGATFTLELPLER